MTVSLDVGVQWGIGDAGLTDSSLHEWVADVDTAAAAAAASSAMHIDLY